MNNYNVIQGGTTFDLVVVPSELNNSTNEIRLVCKTATGPIVINLPLISAFGNAVSTKLYIDDADDLSATNNITINAPVGNTLDNGMQYVIATNGKKIEIYISSLDEYGVLSVSSSSPSTPYSPIVARLSNVDLGVKADNILVWEPGKLPSNTCNYRILVKEVGAGASYTERGQNPSASASTNLNLIGFPAVPTDVYILFNGNVIVKMSKVMYASISDFIDGLLNALYASNTAFGGGNNSPQMALSSPIGAFYNGKSFDIVANSPFGLSYLGVGLTLSGGTDGDSPVIQLKINDRFYVIQSATIIQNSLDLRYLQRNFLDYTGSVVGISGNAIFEWGDWNFKVLQELATSFPVDVILFGDTI